MRRALFALALTALTGLALALAGPANAASAQVTQFRFSGTAADAFWVTSTAASVTDTGVTVSTSNQGSQLFVDQFTAYFDANHNFTGSTDTFAEPASGFSFTVRQPLAGASLSGSGLSATTCTFDANGNQIGCAATAIDVTVTWTGQGAISRGVETSHSRSDGFSVTFHSNGTFRQATATGMIAGLTLSASELQSAVLVTTKSGTTTVCVGNGC